MRMIRIPCECRELFKKLFVDSHAFVDWHRDYITTIPANLSPDLRFIIRTP